MANLPPEPRRLELHIFIQTASKRRQQVFETPAVAGRYSTHVARSSSLIESAVSFPFWNGFACKLFVVGCYAGVGICFTDFHSRRRCSYVPFVSYALRTNCVVHVGMTPTLRNSQKRRTNQRHAIVLHRYNLLPLMLSDTNLFAKLYQSLSLNLILHIGISS